MSSTSDLFKAHKELESYMKGKMAQFEAQFSKKGSTSTQKEVQSDMPPEYYEFKSFAMEMFNLFTQQIQMLQNSVDSLETRQREDILLLRGMPEVDGENVLERTVQTLQDKCLPEFAATSLRQCYRLGHKAEGTVRSVVMHFSHFQVCRDVWKLKSKLKGSSLTITEFLTKPRQAVYQEARRHFGIRNCWTQGAVIYVKLPDGSKRKCTLQCELDAMIKAFPVSEATGTVLGAGSSNSTSRSRSKRTKAK